MSYFPTDIPFMSPEELKANGIEINRSEKSNSSNLRRCPFCNKEAGVKVSGHAVRNAKLYGCGPRNGRVDGEEPYFVVTYRLGCFGCGIVFTHESQFEAREDGSIKVIVDGYKIVADKWNRRGEK